MKNKVITAVLMGFTLALLTYGLVFAASNTINRTRFWLSGWNGPLYLDTNVSNCTRGFHVYADIPEGMNWIGGTYSNFSGTWRAKLFDKPVTNRYIEVQCVDSEYRAAYWKYRVTFFGGTIRVLRVAAGYKDIAP